MSCLATCMGPLVTKPFELLHQIIPPTFLSRKGLLRTRSFNNMLYWSVLISLHLTSLSPFLTAMFLSVFDLLHLTAPLSCVRRSQQTWDIGVQTVTQGHRPRLQWLLPLLLWPWRQSKIHLTSSLLFIPLHLAYLLMPLVPWPPWSISRNTCCIFLLIHNSKVRLGDALEYLE